MTWISPDTALQTGIDIPWNEASIGNVKDDNTATYAYAGPLTPESGTKNIEMGLSTAINCDKIRIWGVALDEESEPDLPYIYLSIYHDGGWDNIFEGLINESAWTTIQLGGNYLLPAGAVARVFFHNPSLNITIPEVQFNEFDFNQLAVRPLVGGSLAAGKRGLV
ncbi:hypothetical protein LCGC14_0849320 [marine sediment metagenome]|uniref:Uncharacterized protein n=1 Tax=marine sediment metagenome TaxID=412755 RepID=A0A0F9PFL6_9ZZZZ